MLRPEVPCLHHRLPCLCWGLEGCACILGQVLCVVLMRSACTIDYPACVGVCRAVDAFWAGVLYVVS